MRTKALLMSNKWLPFVWSRELSVVWGSHGAAIAVSLIHICMITDSHVLSACIEKPHTLFIAWYQPPPESPIILLKRGATYNAISDLQKMVVSLQLLGKILSCLMSGDSRPGHGEWSWYIHTGCHGNVFLINQKMTVTEGEAAVRTILSVSVQVFFKSPLNYVYCLCPCTIALYCLLPEGSHQCGTLLRLWPNKAHTPFHSTTNQSSTGLWPGHLHCVHSLLPATSRSLVPGDICPNLSTPFLFAPHTFPGTPFTFICNGTHFWWELILSALLTRQITIWGILWCLYSFIMDPDHTDIYARSHVCVRFILHLPVKPLISKSKS